MIIELVGLPGSGKSTYAKKYVEKNKAINLMDKYLYNDSRIKQNMNKIKLVSYILLKKRKYCFDLYRIFLKIKFNSRVKKIKMLLYLYSVVGICQKARNQIVDRDIIIDEGVNQVIWGMLYNSRDSEVVILKLQKYLKDYFGDKIILLDIEKNILEERLLKRNSNGGAELNHDIKNDKSKLDYSYMLMEKVKKGIKEVDVTKSILESA